MIIILKVCLKILLIALFFSIVNFILADQPFAKALGGFETCALANNNIFSSLESRPMVDESFEVTSVLFLFEILIY